MSWKRRGWNETWRKQWLSRSNSLAGYLLEDLLISEQVLRDAQYLGHESNGGRKGVLAIKRLCYVCRMLNSDSLKKIFIMKGDSVDSLIDAVMEEFKLYQPKKIPSSIYEAKPKEERCIPIENMHVVYWMWQQAILTSIRNMFV